MSLSINPTDKTLAGVNHSFTLDSDEGPPAGEVLVDGEPVPHRVVFLREPKWKVSFLVPAGAAGKQLTLRFRAGSSAAEQSYEIAAE